MKRLIILVMAVAVGGLAVTALAGDYHAGQSLDCSQCHVMHYSQTHGYTAGGTVFPTLGAGGPFKHLLRNEVNLLCLSCHNENSSYPDVFGTNNGKNPGDVRQGGGLNASGAAPAGAPSNTDGYTEIGGHTLWSGAGAPGGIGGPYVPGTDGLTCTNCHAQHGSTVSYRNLLHRGIFAGDTVTYNIASPGVRDDTKDVFQRAELRYAIDRMDFNEPDETMSKYGQWCQNCHVDFHGMSGDANMGARYPDGWKRHPTADVNLGRSGQPSYVASFAAYRDKPVTNRVKMMSKTGMWAVTTGTTSDLTPSCFSCHKAHGNKNAFGLIFMRGSGAVTEQGDDGTLYRDLCKQCHSQGG